MKKWALVHALGLAAIGCSSPPPPPPALVPPLTTSATAVAKATEAPPPTGPARSYVRGSRAYAVVDDIGPAGAEASLSPDQLILALHPGSQPHILFYDVDRRRIVGRSPSSSSRISVRPVEWLDDGHVLASAYGGEALFDGKTGLLVGQVENGVHAAIATKKGMATLAKSLTSDTAELVLYAEPTRPLARIDVDGYAREAYDFGDGAFAYVGPRGIHAFDADGKPRWKRAGSFDRVAVVDAPGGTVRLVSKSRSVTLSLRDGSEASAASDPPKSAPTPTRVTIAPGAVYAGPKVAGDPILRLTRGDKERLIEPAGGDTFAARCENGAVATLGSGAKLPPVIAPAQGGAAESELTVLSKDGAHRANWASGKVMLTDIRADKSRTIDAGVGLSRAAMHPNGKALVTAAQIRGVGMGWHPDPDASVRVFDLATGALSKQLGGYEFLFSDDGKRLVVIGAEQTIVYDAVTYRKERTWPGLDSLVSLDPTGRFAFVTTHRRPAGGLGPHEVAATFVDDLEAKRRAIPLRGAGGIFAFDASGSRFAYALRAHELDEDVRAITVYELPAGKVGTTIRVDAPIERLAFLGGGKVLAIWTESRLWLHRVSDGRRVSVYAVPDGKACRLFAVDDDLHFQGDPGAKLAFRYGEDLRTSEIVPASAETARVDAELLQKLFAGP